MAASGQVDVRVGLGAGKGEHFADVLDDAGERLFARAVASDQAGLEAVLDRAGRHGTPGLVIGQATGQRYQPAQPARPAPALAEAA